MPDPKDEIRKKYNTLDALRKILDKNNSPAINYQERGAKIVNFLFDLSVQLGQDKEIIESMRHVSLVVNSIIFILPFLLNLLVSAYIEIPGALIYFFHSPLTEGEMRCLEKEIFEQKNICFVNKINSKDIRILFMQN